MVKSLAEYEIEIERMTEWLFNNRSSNIKDKDSFEIFFNQDILEGRKPKSIDDKIRSKSFQRYIQIFDKTISKEREFKKAGGKDLTRDKLTRAKVVVKDFKKFRDLTAQQADFEGLDTPTVITGRIKKRIVRAESQSITRRQKRIIIFRAKNGQFASRKIKR